MNPLPIYVVRTIDEVWFCTTLEEVQDFIDALPLEESYTIHVCPK
jgi:hypothetical protein